MKSSQFSQNCFGIKSGRPLKDVHSQYPKWFFHQITQEAVSTKTLEGLGFFSSQWRSWKFVAFNSDFDWSQTSKSPEKYYKMKRNLKELEIFPRSLSHYPDFSGCTSDTPMWNKIFILHTALPGSSSGLWLTSNKKWSGIAREWLILRVPAWYQKDYKLQGKHKNEWVKRWIG